MEDNSIEIIESCTLERHRENPSHNCPFNDPMFKCKRWKSGKFIGAEVECECFMCRQISDYIDALEEILDEK